MPDDMPELTLEAEGGTLGIAHLLKGAGLVSSTSEAFRMIKQGAVRRTRRGPLADDRCRQH